MRIVCSYCRSDMGEKPPWEEYVLVTHGICPSCLESHLDMHRRLRALKLLSTYFRPAMIVDKDRHIIDINESMVNLLGGVRADVEGLRGGEALGCQNAMTESGCGSQEGCKACLLKKCIETVAIDHSEGIFENVKIATNSNRVLHLKLVGTCIGQYALLEIDIIEIISLSDDVPKTPVG